MISSIKRSWRHWSQSKTRSTIQDYILYSAPALVLVALTTLGVWAVEALKARTAAPAQ